MEVTMTMRGLRDTRRLKALLKAGKSIKLQDRNQVVGRIVPPPKNTPSVKDWPDFEARATKLFGGRVLPGADLVIEERGRY
jgi:hypothetical protein